MPRRVGGVSEGAYASLNLGLETGDRREAVLENRVRVLRALAIPEKEPLRVSQVHGARIVEPSGAPSEADGFLVRAGDPWVAVSAADCAPVALVARDGKSGALVHSGWRGARERIAAQAALRLSDHGARLSEIRVAIGPCIHVCCYPVGEEVTRAFPSEVFERRNGGDLALDLPAAIAWGLTEAGVPREAIHVAPECTSCGGAAYYSHRRDRGVTGRHWGLLRLSVPADSDRA
jgi:hypothetical protein